MQRSIENEHLQNNILWKLYHWSEVKQAQEHKLADLQLSEKGTILCGMSSTSYTTYQGEIIVVDSINGVDQQQTKA